MTDETQTVPRQAGHTPGPWDIGTDYDEAGYPAFYINGLSGLAKRDETVAANARLIAAAPELLEALTDLLEILGTFEEDNVIYDHVPKRFRAARAAIAKATEG